VAPAPGGFPAIRTAAGRVRAELTFAFATNIWFDPNLALASADSPMAQSFIDELSRGTGQPWQAGASSPVVGWADDESAAAVLFPRTLATCPLADDGARSADPPTW
jgi:hypothetical protein